MTGAHGSDSLALHRFQHEGKPHVLYVAMTELAAGPATPGKHVGDIVSHAEGHRMVFAGRHLHDFAASQGLDRHQSLDRPRLPVRQAVVAVPDLPELVVTPAVEYAALAEHERVLAATHQVGDGDAFERAQRANEATPRHLVVETQAPASTVPARVYAVEGHLRVGGGRS